MALENGRITGTQLIFLLIGFIIGSSVILHPGRSAGPDAWAAVLIGLGEGLLFVLVYAVLAARFPHLTLVQIANVVYGPFLGRLVAAAYLWYLFHLGSLVLGSLGDFFTAAIMPETPRVVFQLLIVLVCAWAAREGVEVIARCSQVVVIVTTLLFITTMTLSLPRADLRNLQPILQTPVKKLLWAAHGAAAFPFAETVAFLMIIPFLTNVKDAPRPMLAGVLFVGSFFITVGAIWYISILGIAADIYTYPTFQAMRLLEIAHTQARLEIFVAVSFMATVFLKAGILLYGTALGSAQLLRLRTYQPLVVPIGILMVVLSLTNFASVTENMEFAEKGYPIYAMLFQLVIPFLTLALAAMRRLPRGEP